MSIKPLALTEAQCAIVCAAARSVSPDWRRRFLSSVEDQLTGRDAISDNDVQDAIGRALSRIVGDAA